jgi:hypothetical protein
MPLRAWEYPSIKIIDYQRAGWIHRTSPPPIYERPVLILSLSDLMRVGEKFNTDNKREREKSTRTAEARWYLTQPRTCY